MIISLKDDATIDLVIYNLLGEEVATLARKDFRPAGYYSFIWNGKDGQGNRVSSGIYLVHSRIATDSGKALKVQTRKAVLVK